MTGGATERSRPGHRVWADIDLRALRANLDRVAERLAAGGRAVVVVKSDAYGHGSVPVARALSGHPALWGFGVGDSQEALELRAAGMNDPILILGTIIEDEIPQVVTHDVRVCIHSMDRIVSLEQEARRQGRRVHVHVMADTGMGRLGAGVPRAAELARAVTASEHLVLEGLGTHFSSSRPGHPFTVVQRARLEEMRRTLRADGIDPPLVHASNTAAVLGGEGTDLPLVRPGISLYGVLSPEVEAAGDFEPVMSLRTQIVYLKDVPAGTPVGYNGTWVAPAPTRIATLPLGYNDGLPYRLSNLGRGLVRGQPAPLVGAISMDYTMIDVGAIPGVRVGDTVTLIGRDGDREVTMTEVATLAGTIPYEIACSVGKRVRRLYEKPESTPARGARPRVRDDRAGGPTSHEAGHA